MKSKLAAAAFFMSVAMMCSTSNADLLSRMLGRGGCGGCQATSCCDTPAPSCGGGLSLSINLNIGLPGRLFGNRGGLLSNLGCGGGCDTGCGAPVADTCGGGCGLVDNGCDSGCGGLIGGGLVSRLFNRGGGCGAPVADSCGCNAPAMDPCDSGCGTSLFNGAFLSRIRGRVSGLGSRFGGCGMSNDCGCSAAPAPCAAPAPACGGCETDACGGGRVRGLLDRFSGIGCRSCGSETTCGCSAAPAPAPCAAPAPAPCGGCGEVADACGCGGGKIRGLVSRVGNIGSNLGNNCGCEVAADPCGCDAGGRIRGAVSRVRNIGGNSCGDCGMAVDACSCGSRIRGIFSRVKGAGCGTSACDDGCSNKLSLLDRIRGNRLPRGNACGGCNDGCNPPCPNSGCSDCGTVAASPCGGCGNGTVTYGEGQPMQAAPAMEAAPAMPAAPEQAAPVAPATEGSVVVPQIDGASRAPVVDPSAFVIKK